MPISNYPGGFSGGVNIRGLPLLNSYAGQLLWLDSGGVGADAARYGTFERPFKTLDYAVSQCTANNGDIIMVKPGHAETYSAADACGLDIAGVTVVGLGNGTDQPTFTLDTANTVDINVSAASIAVHNCRFIAGFDSIARVFQVTAAEFVLDGCTFTDSAADMSFVNLVAATSTTANTADGLTIRNCTWVTPDDGSQALVTSAAEIDRLTVEDNHVARGNNAAHLVLTLSTAGDLCAGVKIVNNYLQSKSTAHTGNTILSNGTGGTNTGVIANNAISTLDADGAPGTEFTGCMWFENYYSGAVDKSGYILPARDT